MNGGANPSPFAVLYFPYSKRYPFTAGLTERVFQSSDGWRKLEVHDRNAVGNSHEAPKVFLFSLFLTYTGVGVSLVQSW